MQHVRRRSGLAKWRLRGDWNEANFQLMIHLVHRKLGRMTPSERENFPARVPQYKKRSLLEGFSIHEQS